MLADAVGGVDVVEEGVFGRQLEQDVDGVADLHRIEEADDLGVSDVFVDFNLVFEIFDVRFRKLFEIDLVTKRFSGRKFCCLFSGGI